MAEEQRLDLKIRLPESLKRQWEAMLERKNINQQDALEALVRLVVNESDDVVQSMLLGQTRPTAKLFRALLTHIVEGEKGSQNRINPHQSDRRHGSY